MVREKLVRCFNETTIKSHLALKVRRFQHLGENTPTVSLVFRVPPIVRSWCAVHAAPHKAVEWRTVFTGSLATPHVHFLCAHLVVKRVIYLVKEIR